MSTRSTGVNGRSLNRRMVKLAPRVVISFAYVAWIRCPSGVVPSRIGEETLTDFPQRWPSMTMNELRGSSSAKTTFVFIDSYLPWKMNSGTSIPSHEMSSTSTSRMSESTGPYPTKSRST